jgi:hypothetical protein
MAATRDDDEEKPLDPAAEKLRQRLVRFMVINLVVVFGLVFIVVAALVYRNMSDGEGAAPRADQIRPPEGEGVLTGVIALPSGARIVSQSLSGERLSVEAELAGGARSIFIYDTRLARIIARFDVAVAP